jgi:RND superfamily putative drug exporter
VPGVIAAGDERYDRNGHWLLEAHTNGTATGPTAQRAVSAIRRLSAPFAVSVGGDAAEFHDLQAGIGARLPLALGILLVLTLTILWVMTGSILLPIKAVVMNALTVGVATGTLVWVFQDGHLNSLLSYRTQGGIESLDFLVLATIVFGLSTDYGVFLLTYIKEERDRGADNRESVALGIQRTSGIVTAAATLLAVAIGAFVTSRLVFLQELGVGVAIAVLADAFIVRTLLVPSLMALFGRWNWWQPNLLHRLHGRVSLDRYLGTVFSVTTAEATGVIGQPD